MAVMIYTSLFPTDIEVSMATAVYSFDEADGMVQVCTELTEAPDDGLECSIVVTLWPIDGPKAGTFCQNDWCMISTYFTLSTLSFLVRDSDYSADNPLEVTFMSGSAMQDSTSCAQISIIDDLTFEGPHSFSVEVSTVEIESDGTDPLLTIGTMSSAMVNIEDNDSKPYLYCLTKIFRTKNLISAFHIIPCNACRC